MALKAPSAGVFAADEAAVTELSAALVAAGYTVAARATLTARTEIADQLASWVDDASIGVVIGTVTPPAREALGPLISKRLLGFSDLVDVDAGRCKSTLVVLVPSAGDAMMTAVANVLPRLERELAGKRPPPLPVKVSIPDRVGSASSTKHLPPVAQRLPAAGPSRENSVITVLPPVGDKEVSVVAVIPPVQKKQPPSRPTPPPPPSAKTPPPTPAGKAPRRPVSATSPPPPPSKPAGRDIITQEIDPAQVLGKKRPSAPLRSKEPAVATEVVDPRTLPAESRSRSSSSAPSIDIPAASTEPVDAAHRAQNAAASARVDDSATVGAKPAVGDAVVDAKLAVDAERVADEEPAENLEPAAAPAVVGVSSTVHAERVPDAKPVPDRDAVVGAEPVVLAQASAKVSGADGTSLDADRVAGAKVVVDAAPVAEADVIADSKSAVDAKSSVDAKPAAAADRPAPSTPALPKPPPGNRLFDAPPPTSAVSAIDAAPIFEARATTAPVRKRGIGLWIGIGGALVAAGVLAFVLLGRSSSKKPAKVATPTASKPRTTDDLSPTPTPESPSTEPTTAAGSSEPPEIDFEIDEPGTPTAPTGPTGTTGTTRPSTGATGTTRPATGATGATGTPTRPASRAGTATKTPTGTPTTAAEAPVTADGCDKVSCVIDAYARPCCEQYRPKKPGDLPSELDRGMIMAGMSKAKAAVIRCGELSPAAKGIVRLAMKVTPAGSVEDAAVSEAPDAALGECVSNAVRKVTFARTEVGGSFAYPFKF